MKNAFNELISRLDTVRKESLSLNISQEKSPQVKNKHNKDWKQNKIQNRISKDFGTTTKGVTCRCFLTYNGVMSRYPL